MRTGIITGTVDALRKALGTEEAGFVPTMGALHDGHLSLINRSASENSKTVVSIFVNPTQFTRAADLAAYPRSLEDDTHAAIVAGADIIYAPAVEEIYPPGFATSITVQGLADRWEGVDRPGHFSGVATIVSILLNSVRPARAYFGEKDFQQLVLVKRMIRYLRLPGQIIACPTIRENDGLAMSSRNRLLSSPERTAASAIPRSLRAIHTAVLEGEVHAPRLIEIGHEILRGESMITVHYLTIVEPETLEPVDTLVAGARVLVACSVGSTRLIDNIDVTASGQDI